jgi:hypothetical protein
MYNPPTPQQPDVLAISPTALVPFLVQAIRRNGYGYKLETSKLLIQRGSDVNQVLET